MTIRALLLTLAIGVTGAGAAAADLAGGAKPNTGGVAFSCHNALGVGCAGSISLFPITITIEDVSALNDNHLTILSGDLNDLSVLDGDILDENVVLDDVEATVVSDFLHKFGITVSGNDVDVCTTMLGVQTCK